MQAQAQEAVVRHETAFLKKRLNMKASYKKSKVRITKRDIGYAKLLTQEDINVALEEYQAQQRKLVEAAARKEEKGRGREGERNKGKTVVRGVAAPPTTLVALGNRSGTQIPDSEENIGLRAMLISSDTSDSEAFKVSELYI
ncbi:MAG: hypothetical protein M1813_007230 [Trichoglossum hirsutum]|nr:MAG: hypothetical protein M1813_007230 [Trichoglossum hirsutum]